MKLVLITLSAALKSISSQQDSQGVSNVVSTCGGSEAVEILFSYENSQIEDMQVGEAQIGTCSGNDVNSSYDDMNNLHRFSVANIYNCGVEDNRNPANISTYGYKNLEVKFDAMKVSQGVELSFEGVIFQVSCDLQESYVSSYSFHDGLIMDSEDDGEIDDGVGNVSFEMKSYEDGTVKSDNIVRKI